MAAQPPTPLLILYGSQTGNAQVRADGQACAAASRQAVTTPLLTRRSPRTRPAVQDVAERIGREAARRHYAPRVLPCDAYLPLVAQLPAQPAVLFVASTTGQGDTPDNMRALWKFLLRKSLPPGSLAGMAAAVFGLGDSGAWAGGGRTLLLWCTEVSPCPSLPSLHFASPRECRPFHQPACTPGRLPQVQCVQQAPVPAAGGPGRPASGAAGARRRPAPCGV